MIVISYNEFMNMLIVALKEAVRRKKFVFSLLFILVFCILLYLLSQIHYLLFHTAVELFSIIIAGGLVMISWNSRKYTEGIFLQAIGIAYFFIAALDLFHTLGYKGMGIFNYDYYANQFWVAGRMLEALNLFLVPFFLYLKNKKILLAVLLINFAAAFLLSLSILYWHNFPTCFIAGKGQTLFKLISEYVIIGILLLTFFIFIQKSKGFSGSFRLSFIVSLVLTIFSELSFTLYTDNYGFTNAIGHYFKLLSFYFIYHSIIVSGIQQPFDLIFKELKQKEADLEEAIKAKNRFFSILAHDLKNPFNGLLGFADFLEKNYDTLSDHKRREFISIIQRSSKQAYNLLQNLLNWSRIQNKRLEAQKSLFNMGEIIENELLLFEQNRQNKEITIQKELDNQSYVNADANMISSVARNLLSNAIKFTPRGGLVTVSLKKEEEKIIFSVEDRGIGIPADKIEELFAIGSSYSRPGTEKEEGTGLGLILSKEFIQMNDGQIIVSSIEGKGSCFSIVLPQAASL